MDKMDNLLTPKKIQRLINLAEDKSFNNARGMVVTDEDLRRMMGQPAPHRPVTPCYETSSGILDLDRIEGFGECESLASISLSKSTAFNPGEMTGRSTGATETSGSMMPPPDSYLDSATLGGFISRMQQQTKEVNDVLRQSLSNYSFHSKRDLSADEQSLIAREAPLPVANNTNFQESMSVNNSNLSVGAYFQNKCQDFKNILEHNESPDRSFLNANMMPSISEVSSSLPYEVNQETKSVVVIDDSLDTVPVRQPAINTFKVPTKSPRRSKLPPSQPAKTFTSEGRKELSRTFEKVTPQAPAVSEKPRNNPEKIQTAFTAHKSFMTSSKPADLVLKKLHSSFVPVSEDQGPNDTEISLEDSVSLSKIADYLGNKSEISVSDVMKLNKNETDKHKHINTQQTQTKDDPEVRVTYLKDAKQTETASSANTLVTVINQLQIDVPKVVITEPTPDQRDKAIVIDDSIHEKPIKKSKSPSKSPTTLSTVRDCCSFTSRHSGESPDNSQGKHNRSILPSSNVMYKELDSSVDWQDVYRQKRLRQSAVAVDAQMGLYAQDGWADIVAHYVEGYVGVSCPATISVTTHTDSWLTAVLQFDGLPNSSDLNIELSRIPILLTPGKCENFSCHITANIEMVTALPFTVSLKDASVDGVIEQKGELPVKFVAPTVKAYTSDGKEKIVFPALQATHSFTKSFVIMCESPVDLQLKLWIAEGDSVFSIKSVQEINRSDVEKVLSERLAPAQEQSGKKTKPKNTSTQLCRLEQGKAIKVVVTYTAPRLDTLNISDSVATLNGLFKVNLITSDVTIRKIKLVGSVGVPDLVINSRDLVMHLKNNEPTVVAVTNAGSALGMWTLKYVTNESNDFPFKITPAKFEIPARESKDLTITYTGPTDVYVQKTLVFKETTTGHKTCIEIAGGTNRPKTFPIKTNSNIFSWVRPGRKEISLKNNTDKRVHLKCGIQGDGFFMDVPDGPMNLVLSFDPQQCRTLPIVFRTSTSLPCKATLHLVYDQDCARKIKLFGCSSGEAACWSGLMTYASTALVQAAARAPILLQLYNRSHAPAFLAATVKYDLQYLSVKSSSHLAGAPRVIPGRARHSVTLLVDWAKVERRRRESALAATALATITILTGAEYTRRRILKVLRDESGTSEPDLSLLPDYLRALGGPFDGEDHSMDSLIDGFDETKASLPELVSGLHELTAHVELPQDLNDNTIIICDETLVNHHTIAE